MTCGSCKVLAKSLPVWQKAFPTLGLLANEEKMLGRGKAEDTVRKSFANLIEKGCFCGSVSVGEILSASRWASGLSGCCAGRMCSSHLWPWLQGYTLIPCVTTISLVRHSLKQQGGCQPPSCPATGFGTVLQRRHVGRDGVVRAAVEGVGSHFEVVQYNKTVERDLLLLLASHPCAVFEHVPGENQPRSWVGKAKQGWRERCTHVFVWEGLQWGGVKWRQWRNRCVRRVV